MSGCATKAPSPPWVSGGRFVELPPALDMRSVHAAARVSLEQQGYTVESDSVTHTRGEIIARSPVNDSPGFFRSAIVVKTRRDIEGPIRLTVSRWPSESRDHETNSVLLTIVDTLGVRPLPTLEERQRAEAESSRTRE